MGVTAQSITEQWAMYNGDCLDVMASLPAESVHLSLYSPPFAGLYHYSSDDRDLSNNDDYATFMEHYGFVVRELARLAVPGRMSAVHCMDVPSGNTGKDHLHDFPGDIVRLHEREGFDYVARYCVWKEPFAVRMRTLIKGLAHRTIVDDSSKCSNAAADYLLVFRRHGENAVPIAHPHGLDDYCGERQPPTEIRSYRGWTGKQTENRWSHWIWRQYASAFWDDVRIDRVLPFKAARETEEEKHVHPLQLDVIDRALVLWSNHGEVVLTPFMGVGSEVHEAVVYGRKGIGIELKASYYRQAEWNVRAALRQCSQVGALFTTDEDLDAVSSCVATGVSTETIRARHLRGVSGEGAAVHEVPDLSAEAQRAHQEMSSTEDPSAEKGKLRMAKTTMNRTKRRPGVL